MKNTSKKNLATLKTMYNLQRQLYITLGDLVELPCHDNVTINDIYFNGSNIAVQLINEKEDETLELTFNVRYFSELNEFALHGDYLDTQEFDNIGKLIQAIEKLAHEKLELSHTL